MAWISSRVVLCAVTSLSILLLTLEHLHLFVLFCFFQSLTCPHVYIIMVEGLVDALMHDSTLILTFVCFLLFRLRDRWMTCVVLPYNTAASLSFHKRTCPNKILHAILTFHSEWSYYKARGNQTPLKIKTKLSMITY